MGMHMYYVCPLSLFCALQGGSQSTEMQYFLMHMTVTINLSLKTSDLDSSYNCLFYTAGGEYELNNSSSAMHLPFLRIVCLCILHRLGYIKHLQTYWLLILIDCTIVTPTFLPPFQMNEQCLLPWLGSYFGEYLGQQSRLWAHMIRHFIYGGCCSSMAVNQPPYGLLQDLYLIQLPPACLNSGFGHGPTWC